MPWPIIKAPIDEQGYPVWDYSKGPLPVGWWWYCPWFNNEDGSPNGIMSEEYKRDWLGKRPMVAVVTPNGHEWIIDMHASDSKNGWTVVGEEGKWTATPSILINKDFPSRYHGYLQNGVLTDDIEGKKF